MDQPDRIHLRDYVVTAEIGAFQTERGHPQRLRFDIEVELASHVVGVNDEVDRILKGADYWIDSDDISRRLSRKSAAAKTRSKPVARKTKVTVSAKG